MKNRSTALVIGVLVTAAMGGVSLAQSVEEVKIEATRVPSVKVVGRSTSGVPIEEVSLSSRVNSAGLDLATNSGALAFEHRIHDVASSMCKELGEKYPGSTPGTAECAKAATDKAMVKGKELIAAAEAAAKR